MPYESVDHTGDLAVRLSAPDLAGLIAEGVRALRDALFEGTPPAAIPLRRETLHASGMDREDLLVQALCEALHAMQEGSLYPVEIEVALVGERRCELQLACAHADGASLRRVEEIKAVTYHGIEIRASAEGLETLVVFDV